MTPAAWWFAAWAALPPYPQDAPIPPQPPPFGGVDIVFRDDDGPSPITIFMNFDGAELGACSPSSSRRNCHWYNNDPIAPFSGDLQTRLAIVQAMRRNTDAMGVRVTTLRPEDGDYVMVVYGGTAEEYGALGSAPAGDCGDQIPNEIAFAHLDGELAPWVIAGATTALHEAAHTWGLDHVDLEREIMFPAGGNTPTAFDDRCHRVVDDVALSDGEPTCPDVNVQLCGARGQQNSQASLGALFGPAYVDIEPPRLALRSPEDGQYFQAPASIDVVLDVYDDLHPQSYTMWTWYGDGPRPTDPTMTLVPGFRIEQLPVGSWSFHIAVADEAGHETQLDFDVEVGVDPPPEPEGSGCRVAPIAPPWPHLAVLPALLVVVRRRR